MKLDTARQGEFMKGNTMRTSDSDEVSPPQNVHEVFELIDNQLADSYLEGELVANEGIRLRNTRISMEKLEELVLPIITPIKWIVTSIKNGVLIEPLYTSLLTLSNNVELYHVTLGTNRKSIQEKGLELGTGGNTRIARKYPPRIFLALGIDAAKKFINFQCRSTKLVIRGGRPERGEPEKSPAEFDIWRVNACNDLKLYSDILFPDEAGWTETIFFPNQIELIQ